MLLNKIDDFTWTNKNLRQPNDDDQMMFLTASVCVRVSY